MLKREVSTPDVFSGEVLTQSPKNNPKIASRLILPEFPTSVNLSAVAGLGICSLCLS